MGIKSIFILSLKIIIFVLLLLPTGYLDSNLISHNIIQHRSLDGVPNPVSNADNIVSIDDACADDALDLIGCSSYYSIGGSIDDVTVLIIDYGITAHFWELGEMNGWFDIIQYRVTSEDPDVNDIVIGSDGLESWDDINDPLLSSRSEIGKIGGDHGINTLSALSVVARGIKVVFVTSPTLELDNINHIWEAVDASINSAGIDIDIISLSAMDYTSASAYDPSNTYFEDWENKGIFMLTSSGNLGTKDNYDPEDMKNHKYPQFESEWYSIGSIDFENRDEDPANIHESGSTTGNASPWSSWADPWDENSANSVDFVMPGNGVPVYAHSIGSGGTDHFWAYGAGTSISTPYMAGAVAILIDTYMDMRDYYGGDRIKPSISTIYSVLNDSSSLESYDNKLGWGYVHLVNIYSYAGSVAYDDYLFTIDSDSDGISDGDEINGVNGYYTDPLLPDTDGDDMPDGWEVHSDNNLNPLVDDAGGDKDIDGLINLGEYYLGTKADNSDSDGDGLLDGFEALYMDDAVYGHMLDPRYSDYDYDGIPDGSEDPDGDGLSNFDEQNWGTYPNFDDSDYDQMPDGWEVDNELNPTSSADRNTDFDGDGLSNWEEYGYGTLANDADTDDDGLDDWNEIMNFGGIYNPLLTNTDGIGPIDGLEDYDGDGASNVDEQYHIWYCRQPYWDKVTMSLPPDPIICLDGGIDPTDPFIVDTDGDGLSDGDEIHTYDTDPTEWDTDGDGMPDGWEVQYSIYPWNSLFGLVPVWDDANQDWDGDGVSNLDEYLSSTNPLLDNAMITDFNDEQLLPGDYTTYGSGITWSTDWISGYGPSYGMRAYGGTNTWNAGLLDQSFSDGYIQGWVKPVTNSWQLSGFWIRASDSSSTIPNGYLVILYRQYLKMYRSENGGLYQIGIYDLGEYAYTKWWHIKFKAYGDEIKVWVSKTDNVHYSSPQISYNIQNDGVKYYEGQVGFSHRGSSAYGYTYWDNIHIVDIASGFSDLFDDTTMNPEWILRSTGSYCTLSETTSGLEFRYTGGAPLGTYQNSGYMKDIGSSVTSITIDFNWNIASGKMGMFSILGYSDMGVATFWVGGQYDVWSGSTKRMYTRGYNWDASSNTQHMQTYYGHDTGSGTITVTFNTDGSVTLTVVSTMGTISNTYSGMQATAQIYIYASWHTSYWSPSSYFRMTSYTEST